MDKRHCRACGAEILEGNTYCAFCGSEDIGVRPQTVNAATSINNAGEIPQLTMKQRVVSAVVGILIAVVIVVVVAMAVGLI